MTICVVCYGPHANLARRFLSSLYAHTDPTRFTLRAGLNEVEPATRRFFNQYARRYRNIELFVEPKNIFKNPLMRRLFHEQPLTTPWTIWCDDDTHFGKSDWLEQLQHRIRESSVTAVWGALYYVTTRKPNTLEWIRTAPWYRGLPFFWQAQDDGGRAARLVFATGGFWAMRTDVLYALDWPDPRLIHAGEDVFLGEALRQNGYRISHFDHGIIINDADRRNPDAPEVRELPPAGRRTSVEPAGVSPVG